MPRTDGATPIDQSDDERLRQLLSIEQRLQDLVHAARDDAARRIREARAAGEHRLTAAREAAARADAEQARADRAFQAEALEAIDGAHRHALAAIARLSDSQVDELARWAIAQTLGRPGEPA
jgi:vacuolar-type H+-ATPase subunit H